MYKFEISADSPQELEEKMIEFAREYGNKVEVEDEYKNEPEEIPSFVEPMTFPRVQEPVALEVKEEKLTGASKETPLIDSKGVIYNPEIHSSAKSTNEDGTWRLKRGVNKKGIKPNVQVVAPVPFVPPPAPTSTISEVTDHNNEISTVLDVSKLKAAFVAPVVTHHQPGPIESNQPVGLPEMTTVTAVPVQNTPVTQSYDNSIPVPNGVRPAYSLATFKDNLTLIFANLINEGKINQAYVEQLKTHFKVKEVWNILASEKACVELYTFFGDLGFITRVD